MLVRVCPVSIGMCAVGVRVRCVRAVEYACAGIIHYRQPTLLLDWISYLSMSLHLLCCMPVMSIECSPPPAACLFNFTRPYPKPIHTHAPSPRPLLHPTQLPLPPAASIPLTTLD